MPVLYNFRIKEKRKPKCVIHIIAKSTVPNIFHKIIIAQNQKLSCTQRIKKNSSYNLPARVVSDAEALLHEILGTTHFVVDVIR